MFGPVYIIIRLEDETQTIPLILSPLRHNVECTEEQLAAFVLLVVEISIDKARAEISIGNTDHCNIN